MRSAFFGFHVASTGLFTARANLNVTAHNIANAELPGFSRQVAQARANTPLSINNGRGMYGTGSQVTGIVQMRNRFLDIKFWSQRSIHGQFAAKNTHLNFIETVFNDLPGAGVKNAFNAFFSQLQYLTTRADEPTFRTNVISGAQTLTDMIRHNAQALQRQQRDVNREVADVVHIINSLGSQISSLNRQIHIFERDGSNANDLRDQRALLIDELSQYVNIQVDERDFSRPGMPNDRRMTIQINGQDFIHHDMITRLQLVPRNQPNNPLSGPSRNEMDAPGLYDIFFEGTGARFNIYSPTLGGKLRGLIDVRDGNGGQITGAIGLTGRALVESQLAALRNNAGTIANLITRRDSIAADLPGFIAVRDAAIANRNTAITTRNAHITNLNAHRDALFFPALNQARPGVPAIPAPPDTTVPALSSSPPTMAASGMRTTLAGLTDLTATQRNAVAGVLDNIDTLLFDLYHGRITPAQRDARLSTIQAALNNLNIPTEDENGDPLPDVIDFLSDLNDIFTGIGAVPAAAIEGITAELAEIPLANATIAGYERDRVDAERDMAQLVTLANDLYRQINWVVENARELRVQIENRIQEIQNGTLRGDYTGDLAFLTAALADLEFFWDPAANAGAGGPGAALAPILAALQPMTPPGSNMDFDAPGAFLADLNAQFAALPAAFVDNATNIYELATGNAANPDGLLVAGNIIRSGQTSNFKGIPFYMNQLNHLVRTFARAMNEGLNVDGEQIPGAIGHIFGFDANGQNLQTMLFTFIHPETGQAASVHDPANPLHSLIRWICVDGSLHEGPNPPVNVAIDDLGNPRFTLDYSQLNALNFIVNPDLIEDQALLAASSSHHIGQSNNDIIHSFGLIGSDRSLFREGRLIDFIIATSNHLAVDNLQARNFRRSYEEITMQTHNHRLSIKGVDTNEEMMNLVRFQTMFISASRLVNVLDTIYDTLINRLGNM